MHKFNADVSKVLKLVIHSIYTNKDIFLRELISNASDACEKMRYLVATGECENEDNVEPKIEISINSKEGYISVKDNGIGMNRDELVKHLGTIAKSGTEDFLKQIEKNKDNASELIGQFGVGFYSSYMVSNHVEVLTKRRGEQNPQGFLWVSDGENGFDIKNNKDASFGTEVKVYINEENKEEYLDSNKIENIIKTYSNHISFPIEFHKTDDLTTQINSEKAIWLQPKSQITDEQYENFYHSLCHMPDKPFMILHNKVEGNLEFTNLLFIPSIRPFDLYHPDMLTRIKLYVRHVFISEKDIDIIPHYLRFVYGIVDSNDLPLNMSRETLQDNKILSKIKDNIVSKVFNELKEKAEKEPEQYNEFWSNFGSVLKEGLCESIADRESLMQMTRFYTNKSKDKVISFDEYIKGMKENQKDIFFFIGEDINEMMSAPEMEVFNKNDIEVILFTDVVDSFWTNVVHDYKGKDLKSITRSDIDLNDLKPSADRDSEQQNIENSEVEKEMINNFMKVLTGKVCAVKITNKLIDSPSCLSVAPGAMDSRMEDYLVAQKQLKKRSLKILEINPDHELVKKANDLLRSADGNGDSTKHKEGEELVLLINDLASISSEEHLENANLSVKRILKWIK